MGDFNEEDNVLTSKQKFKKILLLFSIFLIFLLIAFIVFYIFSQRTNNSCTENWSCGIWSSCSEQITSTRICTDLNNCGTSINKPFTSQNCNLRKASLLEVPLMENIECFYNNNMLLPKCGGFYEDRMPVCEKFYNPVYDSNGIFYPSACWAENFGIMEYTYGYSTRLKQFINDLWFTKKIGESQYFKVPEPDIEFTYSANSGGGDREGTYLTSVLWKNSTDFYILDYNIDTKTQVQQSTFFLKRKTLKPVYSIRSRVLIAFVMFDNAYPEDILLNWTETYGHLLNDYIKKKQKVPNPIQYEFVPIIINPPQGIERLSQNHIDFSAEEGREIFNSATSKIGESDFDIFVISPVSLNGFGGSSYPRDNVNIIMASLSPQKPYSEINKQDGLNSLASFQFFFQIIHHEILHTLGMESHTFMGYGTTYLSPNKIFVDKVTGKYTTDSSFCDFLGESPDFYAVEIPDNLIINLGEEPSWLFKESSSSLDCLTGLYQRNYLIDSDKDGEYEIVYDNNLIGIELQRTLGWVDIDNDGVTELVDSNPYGGYEEFISNEEQRGEVIGPFKFTFIEYQDIGDCRFAKIRLENLNVGLVPMECLDFNEDVVNIYNGLNYHWIKIEDNRYGTILLPRLINFIQ